MNDLSSITELLRSTLDIARHARELKRELAAVTAERDAIRVALNDISNLGMDTVRGVSAEFAAKRLCEAVTLARVALGKEQP